jgi:hypothetical protein
VPGDAVPSPADPAEFLDVDLDELAGAATLLAGGRLGRLDLRQLAQPDAAQDYRDGRQRHRQAEGDLRARYPQPAQRGDDLDARLAGAVAG